MIKFKYPIILIFIIFGSLGFVLLISERHNQLNTNTEMPAIENNNAPPSPDQTPPAKKIAEPISYALTRITKKSFGIKVTPQDSPVQPERFSGYHTGVDFETFPDEQNSDVQIYAICAGPLISKKIATGYGGVAVQQCQIENADVTVIYGHLRLTSITANLNQILESGQTLGLLGTGFSTETSGERKHLHLGIHQGKNINLLGYVQSQGDLTQWLDFKALFE